MFPWRKRFAGLAAFGAVRAWMSSLNYCALFSEPTTDPASPRFQGPVIAVFWHDALLVPFYLYGHTHTVILTSQHRDADWIASTAAFLGYRTVRGSTYRGGDRALLKLARSLRGYNLGIACDGPRGPRRQMAAGPVYLSSRLQIPIVPYGIACQRAWRLATWDRFALPYPGSTVYLIHGQPLQVPSNANRQELLRYRQRAQNALDQVSRHAEWWSAAGCRMAGQQTVRRRPMPATVQRRLRQQATVDGPAISGGSRRAA